MTQEHTQAPWLRVGLTVYAPIDGDENNSNKFTCLIQGLEKDISLKELRANAQIIAAAPVMLREMDKFVRSVEDTGHEPPQSFYDAMKEARES